MARRIDMTIEETAASRAYVHGVVMRLRNYDECHDGDIDEAADMLLKLWGFVERAKPIVEQDAMMMADLTRFDPESLGDKSRAIGKSVRAISGNRRDSRRDGNFA